MPTGLRARLAAFVEGRTPEGEAARFLHEVVLVHDNADCLLWPFGLTQGYGVMHHKGKTRRVSRIVCETVAGPPPTPRYEAAHSCGNGHLGCVNPRHLRWATSKENSEDQALHGTQVRGERQGSAKLTADAVLEIRRLRIDGMKLAEIAARYGVDQSTVSRICRRTDWQWLA